MRDLRADKLLLLQAAFASGEQAESARRRWQGCVDFDAIDAESQRAVPQLHLKNTAAASSDSRIQGLYRRAWYSNALLSEQIKPVRDRLAADGVRALAAKQSAVVAKARGCYPLDRFHLLVADDDLEKTMTALRDSGWSSRLPLRRAEAGLRGINFERGEFLLQLSSLPALDNGFWGRIERIESDADRAEVPGNADQLLEAAAPKYIWHQTTLYQRLLETLLVIEHGKQQPDWSTLEHIGAKAGLTLPLADILEYLERDFGVALPNGYLACLRGTLATRPQASEYRLKRQTRSLWQRIRLSILEYRSLKELSVARNEPLSLVDYLKLRWNVSDVKGIVKHVALRFAKPKRDPA
ncbi:MAG TPA: hypothetical protein VMR74_16010 [Gammaproteobacteria bacterium]|nr:hypothetical protein [Gammaproteobacteria bacterium]